MLELVDRLVSGTSVGNGVGVRVSLGALQIFTLHSPPLFPSICLIGKKIHALPYLLINRRGREMATQANPFATSIAGVALENLLIVAGGMIKTIEDVKRIAPSMCAAITIGSATLDPRGGNEGDSLYYYDLETRVSLNSLGLPNRGSLWYKENLPGMVTIAHDHGKPVIFNAAGFSPKEYAILASIGYEGGADIVELNLGCPNVWHGAEQHTIASFDLDVIQETLLLTRQEISANAVVCIKLSPFSDPFLLAKVATILSEDSLVKAVTACNTWPNGYLSAEGKPKISGGGLAGAAGPGLHAIYLGQVKQLRPLLPDRIDIVATGGIEHGGHVLESIHAGASACGIATLYMQKREQAFTDIMFDLAGFEQDGLYPK